MSQNIKQKIETKVNYSLYNKYSIDDKIKTFKD